MRDHASDPSNLGDENEMIRKNVKVSLPDIIRVTLAGLHETQRPGREGGREKRREGKRGED